MRGNSKKSNGKQRSRALYHAAKISDYRFKSILWHYVRDHSASKTARSVKLSINSVHAIFRKIRVYYFEVGLFVDFYDGQEPTEYLSDNPGFEIALLEFHFSRVRSKNGLKSPAIEPPYHFAESCWRYDFQMIAQERNSRYVHDMMLSHLLEIIRTCGPIGAKPTNRRVGILAVLRQYKQRVSWLTRNAPAFGNQAMD